MVFIRDSIPRKIKKKHSCENDTGCLFIELKFRKSKRLLFGMYHPPSQNDEYYFNYPNKALETYSSYENVLLAGNFNLEITKHDIESNMN